MKGLTPLVLGILATLAFSWLGLAYIPDLQIGHLDPQSDEEGTDIYPMPKSGMAERGRRIYVANGCFYCHSEQVRADYAAADMARPRDAASSPPPKWGDRRSAPRDYIFDRPALLGKMRMGPDLANIGKAARPRKKPRQYSQAQRIRRILLRLVRRRPLPMSHLHPETPRRSKTPSLPRNHLPRQHLLRRRPPRMPHLRPRTPRPNKTPSPPRNHLLHQHLLRRCPRPMPRPRRQTPRPNKMLSLLHNHLLRRRLLHRPRKPPQLLRLLRHLRNPRRPTPLPGIINISMRPAV